MYDIGIPEIRCTDRYEDPDGISIKYFAEAVKRPTICPHIDLSNPKDHERYTLHRHSFKYNLIQDTRSEGKLVYINLKINRYRCSECGAIIPDTFTFYDQKAHTTNRLRAEYVRRCIKGETFSYIANDYGVDHKTVAAAFKAYAAAHVDELTYDYTPRILGIDEAHIDDHFRLVLTDIENQRFLDMKKDNSPSTVKKYLKTLDKSICECVAMDFAPIYASAVSTVLPKTTIVIDKFHVIQEINRSLDKVRRQIQKDLKARGEDIRRLKKSRLLFLTNMEDLKEKYFDTLNSWFILYPDLYEAYMCKETFRDIYLTAKTYEKATEMFNVWLEAVPGFAQFAPMKKTMNSRREHILNYWHYEWTNAYTESVNNIIKKIEKAGRGYKFETLRERCILEINSPKPAKFNPKTADYLSQSQIEEMNKKKYHVFSSGQSSKLSKVSLEKHLSEYLKMAVQNGDRGRLLSRMEAYYERLSINRQ